MARGGRCRVGRPCGGCLVKVAEDPRDAALGALVVLLDGGSVEFRTGSQPASPSDDATGTLLATVPLPTPCFDVASGIATANAIAPVDADEGGTVGWYRAKDALSVTVLDGDSGEMTISSLSISTDESVEIIAWVITLPEG